MPSANSLKHNQEQVAKLVELLKSSVSGVIVDYKGINVAEDTVLRRELRAAGVEYHVVKNTMLRFAIKEVGLDGLADVLEGTTAIAVSKDDQTAPARVIAKFSDQLKDKFNIKSGFIDGAVYSAKDITAIGKLPSKDQLIGQLLSVLTGNLRGLAVALNAIAEKNGDAA